MRIALTKGSLKNGGPAHSNNTHTSVFAVKTTSRSVFVHVLGKIFLFLRTGPRRRSTRTRVLALTIPFVTFAISNINGPVMTRAGHVGRSFNPDEYRLQWQVVPNRALRNTISSIITENRVIYTCQGLSCRSLSDGYLSSIALYMPRRVSILSLLPQIASLIIWVIGGCLPSEASGRQERFTGRLGGISKVFRRYASVSEWGGRVIVEFRWGVILDGDEYPLPGSSKELSELHGLGACSMEVRECADRASYKSWSWAHPLP